MSTRPEESLPTPRWLVWPATSAGSLAVLMGSWQVANLGIGFAVGDHVGEVEGLVRVSAGAGAIAMLATLPAARFLLRRARASAAVALLMLFIGVTATYYLVPRAFMHASF